MDDNKPDIKYQDHEKREIRLTDERLQHILEHAELVGQIERIAEVIASPELVVISAKDETVIVYHRLYEKTPVTRKYLHVVVKVLEEDAFILTAYFSNRKKKGIIKWQS
jgi:esterase/lipase